MAVPLTVGDNRLLEVLDEDLRRFRALGHALARLPDASGTRAVTDPEAVELVHEMRKQLKTLRASHRLQQFARGQVPFRTCDRQLREAGRVLANARRTAALLGCLTRLRAEDGLSGEAASAAARLIEEEVDSTESGGILAARALSEIEGVDLGGTPSLRQVLRALRAQAELVERRRRACERDPGDEALHRLRKAVKAYRTQLKLLGAGRRETSALGELADLLGELHDLADLKATLSADPLGESVWGSEICEASERARARLLARVRELSKRIELDPEQLGVR